MAGTTPVYALPYPSPPDPADVPADMQALASRIEAVVGPGTVNGQIPVWDQTNKKWVASTPNYPGRQLAYNEITANVTISGTTAALSTLVIAGTAITVDGATALFLDFFSPGVYQPAGASSYTITVGIFESGAVVGASLFAPQVGTQATIPLVLQQRVTPSAGSRTYSVRAWVTANSGIVAAGATGGGGFAPAFLRVTTA